MYRRPAASIDFTLAGHETPGIDMRTVLKSQFRILFQYQMTVRAPRVGVVTMVAYIIRMLQTGYLYRTEYLHIHTACEGQTTELRRFLVSQYRTTHNRIRVLLTIVLRHYYRCICGQCIVSSWQYAVIGHQDNNAFFCRVIVRICNSILQSCIRGRSDSADTHIAYQSIRFISYEITISLLILCTGSHIHQLLSFRDSHTNRLALKITRFKCKCTIQHITKLTVIDCQRTSRTLRSIGTTIYCHQFLNSSRSFCYFQTARCTDGISTGKGCCTAIDNDSLLCSSKRTAVHIQHTGRNKTSFDRTLGGVKRAGVVRSSHDGRTILIYRSTRADFHRSEDSTIKHHLTGSYIQCTTSFAVKLAIINRYRTAVNSQRRYSITIQVQRNGLACKCQRTRIVFIELQKLIRTGDSG